MKVEEKGKLTIVLLIFGSALILIEVDDTPAMLDSGFNDEPAAGASGVAGSGFGTPAWGFTEEDGA